VLLGDGTLVMEQLFFNLFSGSDERRSDDCGAE
jgi:hypothetical protein